jgi:hypothetical protein
MKKIIAIKFVLAILIAWSTCFADTSSVTPEQNPDNAQGDVHPFVPYRQGHSSTVLNNGRILIVGGSNSDAAPSTSAEFFDTEKQRFFRAPTTTIARSWHFALHLKDDRVVVAGGLVTDGVDNKTRIAYTPEIYTPASESWTQIRDIQFNADDNVYAAVLADGNVLFVASNEQSIFQSKRADAKQFRAWIWDVKRNTVTNKSLNAGPRAQPIIVVLRDGRVLVTGGSPLIFRKENRCEETSAKQKQGNDTGSSESCGNDEGWSGTADTNTEIWDSRNEKVAVLPALPLTASSHAYTQQLKSGDVLIISQSVPNPDKNSQAVMWSIATGAWRKIANPLTAHYLNVNHSLLEQVDGSLLAHDYRYSLSDNVWVTSPSVSFNATLLQLPGEHVAALSLSEPYLRVLDPPRRQWQVRTNAYWRIQNTTLALRDGRLLAVGAATDGGELQTVIQLWDPKSDIWTLQDLPAENALQQTQLAQMESGHVLRIGLVAKGRLECLRWLPVESPSHDEWVKCGHFQLKPGAPNPNIRYADENDRPPRYNFAVGKLDDGRILLVENLQQAYLYNEKNNVWLPVSLQAQEQALVHGAPIRLAAPLYRFRDVGQDHKWIDASSVAVRYQQGEPLDYKADMMWDAQNHQWRYIFTDFRMGHDAALLPDGCVINLLGNGFRLFNPATGMVEKLPAPLINFSGSLAVLADGTVTVAGSTYEIGDRRAHFFAERASCNGFASAIKANADAAKKTSGEEIHTPAKSLDKSGESSEPLLIKIGSSSFELRWIALAIFIPLMAYFLLRELIHVLAKYDRVIEIPKKIRYGLLVVLFGILGICYGPTLWMLSSGLFGHVASDSDDDSYPVTTPWYQFPARQSSLPENSSVPCSYVGFWSVRNINPESTLEFRYSMYDDGHLEARAVRDGKAHEVLFTGIWAVQGKNIVWLKDGLNSALQTDEVVSKDANLFNVRQSDGQYRQFFLIANPGRKDCIRDIQH